MWAWLALLWTNAVNWLSGEFGSLLDSLANLGNALLSALAGLETWLGNLLSGIWSALQTVLDAVYWFFSGLIYLLEAVMQIVVKIAEIIGLLLQVFISLAEGLLNTFGSLSNLAPGSAPPAGAFSGGLSSVVTGLNPYGLQTVGYVLAAIFFLAGAWYFFKMIGGGANA